MQDQASIDPRLTELLASTVDVYLPNTSFLTHNETIGQVALAITGGYRTRLALAGGGGEPAISMAFTSRRISISCTAFARAARLPICGSTPTGLVSWRTSRHRHR